mmetsp:Transcript_11106/g.17831  ORF Transcript_11106/g.17831 Transcript_11106/m.17831 type:complete len:233 (+) Transcript_11106:507-1205(+)
MQTSLTQTSPASQFSSIQHPIVTLSGSQSNDAQSGGSHTNVVVSPQSMSSQHCTPGIVKLHAIGMQVRVTGSHSSSKFGQELGSSGMHVTRGGTDGLAETVGEGEGGLDGLVVVIGIVVGGVTGLGGSEGGVPGVGVLIGESEGGINGGNDGSGLKVVGSGVVDWGDGGGVGTGSVGPGDGGGPGSGEGGSGIDVSRDGGGVGSGSFGSGAGGRLGSGKGGAVGSGIVGSGD